MRRGDRLRSLLCEGVVVVVLVFRPAHFRGEADPFRPILSEAEEHPLQRGRLVGHNSMKVSQVVGYIISHKYAVSMCNFLCFVI